MTTYYFPKHTAQEYRDMVYGQRKSAEDSFERCDTDGFLSQWAAGQMAGIYDSLADLVEAGGEWTFTYLADLEGNLLNARLINGKYGACWMILDAEGKSTGQFAPYHPAKESTLAKRGYKEIEVTRPACVRVLDGSGYSLNVHYWPIEWLKGGSDSKAEGEQ